MDALFKAASSGPALAFTRDMHSDENRPGLADHVGQAAGGIGGVLAGAAVGVVGGPVGVLLGGIAGAIGGWWSGRAIVEAASDITPEDTRFYDADFERRRAPRRQHDRAMGAYYLGDIAAANPEYARRAFEEVEPELERGWNRCADGDCWEEVRECARVGFARGAERRSR